MARIHWRARLIALASLVVAVACGGRDASTAPESTAVGADIAGSWGLHTVNGTQLPYALYVSGADSIALVSDIYELRADGTFRELAQVRYVQNGMATVQTGADSGRFVVAGSALKLTYADGYVSTGGVSGTDLTMSGQGYALVYRKQ